MVTVTSKAQYFDEIDEKSTLMGGSLGMAFPGGESDPELNCSLIFLYHNQVAVTTALEIQAQGVISTAPSYGDGWKFILPIDARVFLGSRSIAGFVGAGFAYTMVSDGEREFDGPRLNQLATNIAIGGRIGFWKNRRHLLIFGTKVHLPLCQTDGLSDKPVFALIGGIGFNNRWGAIKLDYEYPLGKQYENLVYGINSQAFSVVILFNI